MPVPACPYLHVHLCANAIGDYNVPRGETSFRVMLGEPGTELAGQVGRELVLPHGVDFRDELYPGHGDLERLPPMLVRRTCRAQGQVSDVGFKHPAWVDAEFVEFTNDYFGMLWTTLGSFSLYTRAHLPPGVFETEAAVAAAEAGMPLS